MFNNPYEGANIFDYFEKLQPMTGEEIADELGFYCTECEVFFTEIELEEGRVCPLCSKETIISKKCTRQNVSRILKDVMEKFYFKVKVMNRNMSPFEVAAHMMEMLGVNQRDEGEISKFYTLFPVKLKTEIEEDGKRILGKYCKHKRE